MGGSQRSAELEQVYRARLQRSRGKAAEANRQKYYRAKPNHSQETDREEQTQVGRRSLTGLAAARTRSRSGRGKVEKVAVAADKR